MKTIFVNTLCQQKAKAGDIYNTHSRFKGWFVRQHQSCIKRAHSMQVLTHGIS